MIESCHARTRHVSYEWVMSHTASQAPETGWDTLTFPQQNGLIGTGSFKSVYKAHWKVPLGLVQIYKYSCITCVCVQIYTCIHLFLSTRRTGNCRRARYRYNYFHALRVCMNVHMRTRISVCNTHWDMTLVWICKYSCITCVYVQIYTCNKCTHTCPWIGV